jgi:hypothetical protein
MKPAAGIFQVFSMPAEGGVKNLCAVFNKGISQERVLVRRTEGVLAVKQASQEDQDAVLRAFAKFKATTSRDRKGKGKLS